MSPGAHRKMRPIFFGCSMKAAYLFASVLLVAFVHTSMAKSPDLQFTTLARGAFSTVREARQVVIRDQAAFKAVWAEMHAGRTPTPEPPVVEFATQTVVGVFLGTRRTGGYSVAIERIAREATSGAIVVFAVESTPPPGAMLIQALTQPFHLVTISASSAAVRFVLTKRQ